MQITLRLKGFLRIALFVVLPALSVTYAGYKAWKYFHYRTIISETQAKRVRNFQPLPFDYKMEVKDTAGKGYLLLAPYVRFNLKYGRIVIMDLAGHIVYQRPSEGAVIDLRQWDINGRRYYTYGIDDPAARHLTLSAGHIVLLDSSLRQLKQIHLLPYDDITTANHEDLDLHDFILFNEDHYIVAAACQKTVSNIPVYLHPAAGNKVATTIIQEVKDGRVIWQWDGSRFTEFYMNSVEGNHFYDTTAAQDYMHINSMVIDPRDSNLVVSFRQLNQVVKISRRTGEILWRLGGRNSDFPLSSQQVFLRQHNATLVDGGATVLLFDNGDKNERPYSRILEFRLDEQKRVIDSFREFRIAAPISGSLGSVQKLGDDYLICGGSANYIMLVNSRTGVRKMELKANQSFYRAYLVNDIKGIDTKGR